MKTFTLYCAMALLAGFAVGQAQAAEPRGAHQACTQDYQRLCKSVQPAGGRVIACLQQHQAELSAPCQTQMNAMAACAPEIKKICGSDASGLRSCLKAHAAEFSAACQPGTAVQ